MRELQGTDAGVGSWQGVPLSAGRVVEDALALTWRLRRLIAPIIFPQMIVAVLSNFVIAAAAPIDISTHTTALQSSVPPNAHPDASFFGESFALFFISTLFIVAMTKVMYAAYHDHTNLPASKSSGFVLGTVRTVLAQVCFALLAIFGFIAIMLVPAVILGIIDLILTLTLGRLSIFAQVADGISLVLLGLFSIVYILLATIGSQYIIVGAMIRRDNMFHLIQECFAVVRNARHFKRLLSLGAMLIGIVVALLIVMQLIAHIVSGTMGISASFIAEGVLQAIVLTPLMTAFGVVFYVDAAFRLARPEEAT